MALLVLDSKPARGRELVISPAGRYLDVVRFRRARPRGIAPFLTPGSKMSDREYEEWYELHSWDPSRRTELVIESDLTPASWLEPLLVPNSFEVRMTAPQGYDAYARIFFPFVGKVILEEGEPIDQEHVTWTEMARRNGRIVHALMEQETIRRPPDGEDVVGHGSYGSLMPEQFEALMPILSRHTSSTSAWFLLWDGFGDLSDQAFDNVPKVMHPARSFFLLKGPLGSYADFPHDPNYFWPDDRAWSLCTDTDFDWAYLAASAACVDEALAVPIIDALATRPENPARSGMDVINDPEGIVPRSL